MTEKEDFARRQATQNLESSLFIFITRFDQKREELESLASQLYNDSFCDLIADIFERGLDEVRSIKAESDARPVRRGNTNAAKRIVYGPMGVIE